MVEPGRGRGTPAASLRWTRPALLLIGLGLVLLASPARLEGRRLLEISPDHALSVLDSAALVPLLTGSVLLYTGLWRRRQALLSAPPGALCSLGVMFGFGMGLAVASVASTFAGWWIAGTGLAGLALAGAVVLVTRRA